MNLCFTHESHGTLKSFTLFITVNTITKLNLGYGDDLKISRRGSRSPDNAELVISRQVVVLQRTAKKCTKNYNATCTAIVLLIYSFVQ